MTDDAHKYYTAQVASPPRPLKLVHDIGDRLTALEADGSLAAIAAIRRYLDQLERAICLSRIASHDDGNAA